MPFGSRISTSCGRVAEAAVDNWLSNTNTGRGFGGRGDWHPVQVSHRVARNEHGLCCRNRQSERIRIEIEC